MDNHPRKVPAALTLNHFHAVSLTRLDDLGWEAPCQPPSWNSNTCVFFVFFSSGFVGSSFVDFDVHVLSLDEYLVGFEIFLRSPSVRTVEGKTFCKTSRLKPSWRPRHRRCKNQRHLKGPRNPFEATFCKCQEKSARVLCCNHLALANIDFLVLCNCGSQPTSFADQQNIYVLRR